MRLLIIGSTSGAIAQAGKIAHMRGATVMHCENIDQALAALRSGKGADLIMAEVKQNIAVLVKSLDAEHIAVPVVACGLEPDSKAAVAAIQAGAREFIHLPPEPDLIAAILETAAAPQETNFIANAPAMKAVVKLADKVASSIATVLITGESGTGKEVMASYLHKNSDRKANNFIALNCAAIPEALLESELFGHDKGAFTGAAARRIGKFEEADGGTILLDEISEMAAPLQSKLLRALQEREITRVGSNEVVKVDVRVIATSNRDMQKAISDGDFRADLYYRLNVITLDLPPLRERKEDIPALAEHFAKHYAEVNGAPMRDFSSGAIEKLCAHSWQGNVRELENAIHRAVLVADGDKIDVDAIILGHSGSGKTLEQIERDAVNATIGQCLGDQNAAAKILGISLRVLREKMEKHSNSD